MYKNTKARRGELITVMGDMKKKLETSKTKAST